MSLIVYLILNANYFRNNFMEHGLTLKLFNIVNPNICKHFPLAFKMSFNLQSKQPSRGNPITSLEMSNDSKIVWSNFSVNDGHN